MTTVDICTNNGCVTEQFLSAEDYAWVVQLAEMEPGSPAFVALEDEELARACQSLAHRIVSARPRKIEWYLEAAEKDVVRFGNVEPFARLMRLGLEVGVAADDGACCNYLGACYYMGGQAGVEQDYQRAKELYEKAERKGIPQAIVNLGYIYEYGRTGEPDYQRAFQQYAKAALAYDQPEALYKLGDLYARGRLGEPEFDTALRLYEASLNSYVEGVPEACQPAFRIAQLVGDPANQEQGITCQPLRALELFQLAERGLRVEIARGQTHYATRLQQALEGQDRMREALTQEDLLG